MSILRKLRRRLRGKAARQRRLEAAAYYLMKYVGITGQCECRSTCDADGHGSYLLIIKTPLSIPVMHRELLQHYFRRKLTELRELGPVPLMLLVCDRDDLMRAVRGKNDQHASSARVAAIVAAANLEQMASQTEVCMAELRQQFAFSRFMHLEDRNYVPPPSVPMTDLGGF